MYTCVCAFVRVFMYVTHMYTYMTKHTYVCMCVYIYIYVYFADVSIYVDRQTGR